MKIHTISPLKKAAISLVVFVLMCVASPTACLNVSANPPDTDQTWYTENPYEQSYTITTAAQLTGLAQLVNNATQEFQDITITLDSDVDLSGVDWVPIGLNDTIRGQQGFKGTFDGGGHVVSGLNINDSMLDVDFSDSFAIGLFGRVSGSIENLNVMVDNLSVSTGNVQYVGALAGHVVRASTASGANITNCHVLGSENSVISIVASDGLKAGGLIGALYGYKEQVSVSNCSAAIAINVATGEDDCTDLAIGGLIGAAVLTCSVSEAHAASQLTVSAEENGNVTTSDFGGLVGNFTGNMSNCYADTTLHSDFPANIGGLIGQATNGSTVNHCHATGSITAQDKNSNLLQHSTGGLLGLAVGDPTKANTTVTNATANVMLTNTDDQNTNKSVGALCGDFAGTLNASSSSGTTVALHHGPDYDTTNGLVGRLYDHHTTFSPSTLENTLTAPVYCPPVTALAGTPFDFIPLPTTVSVTTLGVIETAVVKWNSDEYTLAPGTYNISGQLLLRGNTLNPNNFTAQITINTAASLHSANMVGSLTPTVGVALTAEAFSAPQTAFQNYDNVTFQWQSSKLLTDPFVNIGDATAQTYTPISADIDRFIRVLVTAEGLAKSATTAKIVEPAAFTYPTVASTTSGDKNATVTWVSANPTTPLYNVYYKQSDTPLTTAQSVKTGATFVNNATSPLAITNLVNAKHYYVVVEAVYNGQSNDSDVMVVTPNAVAIFTTPPIITSVRGYNQSLTLHWTAAVPAADFYTVYCLQKDGATPDVSQVLTSGVASDTTTHPTATLSNLTNGKTYYLVVTATKSSYPTASTSAVTAASPFVAAERVTVIAPEIITMTPTLQHVSAIVYPSNSDVVRYQWHASPADYISFDTDDATSVALRATKPGNCTITCTVTNETDGSSVSGTHTLYVQNNQSTLLGFKLNGYTATINETAKTLLITMPYTTDVTNSTAVFSLSSNATATIGDALQTSGLTPNDFTTALTYTVTSEDHTSVCNYALTLDYSDLPPVATPLGLSFGANAVATWEAVANAEAYTVQLYKNGVALNPTHRQTLTTHDFLNEIKQNGVGLYTFGVTALGNGLTAINGTEAVSDSYFELLFISEIIAPLPRQLVVGVTEVNANLPTSLSVKLNNDTLIIVPVHWSGFDSTAHGAFTLSGAFDTLPLNVMHIDDTLQPKLHLVFSANDTPAQHNVANRPDKKPASPSASPSIETIKTNDETAEFSDNTAVLSSTDSLSKTAVNTDDAPYAQKTFVDIDDHWAKIYIDFVTSKNWFNGVSETNFDPNGHMTRAMFVTVLSNLDHADLSDNQPPPFSDVPMGAWYAAPVTWASASGIAHGVGDELFAPNATITREQLAVMMHNYMRHKGYGLESQPPLTFIDASAISPWAKEAVAAMGANGLMSGKPGDLYDPAGTATRAESATLLANFAHYVQATKKNAP